MTTTLRPTGPIQQSSGGARVRAYAVCVNSRVVGTLELGTDTPFGPSVGEIRGLRIEEADRGRGRGAVAALAAEEVLRSWNCSRVRTSVPAESAAGNRLAAALGYRELGRNMAKELGADAAPLPAGARGRPMTEEEFARWRARSVDEYAQDWADRGLPVEAARTKSLNDHARLLPEGLATPGTRLSMLEAPDAGGPVGHVWVAEHEVLPGRPGAYVFNVEVDPEYRGRGHGRSLMLLAEQLSAAAGAHLLGLHVFSGNTPALRLYESLGYLPTNFNYAKDLI